VIVSAFFCAITISQGSNFVYITCYTLIAGALGFLICNFPPARIFMGDVGSTFLGFSFAVLAIIAARYDNSHTSFLVMPLLLFNFIWDTFFTFLRRLLRGEPVPLRRVRGPGCRRDRDGSHTGSAALAGVRAVPRVPAALHGVGHPARLARAPDLSAQRDLPRISFALIFTAFTMLM